MNQPDAGKLLGGHATGNLTAAEKQILYSAALEHQELFDALMDEEALRELLADPVSRDRVLKALSRPGKPRILWGRPAFLGLAASLFALVTTGYVVWRGAEPALPGVKQSATLPLAKEQPEVQVQDVTPKLRSFAQSPPTNKLQKGGAQKPPATNRLVESQAKSAFLPSSIDTSGAASSSKAAAASEVVPQAGFASVDEEEKRSVALGASAPLKRAIKAKAEAIREGLADRKDAPAATILERLQDGRFRLRVTWGPEGHLRVVKRTSAKSAWLEPTETPVAEAGAPRVAIFEFAAGDQDVVELYVLPAPVSTPAELPKATEGWRVFPERK